jgi:hypothetical protein
LRNTALLFKFSLVAFKTRYLVAPPECGGLVSAFPHSGSFLSEGGAESHTAVMAQQVASSAVSRATKV